MPNGLRIEHFCDNSESSELAGSKLTSVHVCLHSFDGTTDQNKRFG